MKYNLKTDNYKTFEVFSDNLLVPRSYFIPFESEKELDSTDIRNERYLSSLVTCLSGKWNFKYFEKLSDMPDLFDSEKIDMDEIDVPSMWQYTGYEKPYYVNIRYQFKANPPAIPEDCSVGVYTKEFEIENTKLTYTLTFLGVAGSIDLFCNGKYVGYSEGSHNTAEFELNDFVVKGKNEIAVVVHKWCNGTYLECQDMFRSNGIFRDVLLKRTGENSIYDIEAKTKYENGKYHLDVIPSLKLTSNCEFCAALFDNDDCVVSKSVNVSNDNIDVLSFDDLIVSEWSAECPKLYDLIITLICGGKTVEVIRKRIGFKHIEIKGNVFYFNNKNIKLLGVNHHDTNPKTGYVMTVDDMEKDIKIFKDYNVNCVRTSHYPPDPTFLDLCDEYGIYVVDEADIETHGCGADIKRINKISNDLAWKDHYKDRVYRMYARDKNHPSITMWSLGNESGGIKCQDYCVEMLKGITDIPIHYEAACRSKRWAYDVISQMYTFLPTVNKIAAGKGLPKKYYVAPFYLCEYAHAMGLGAGDLEKYIDAFYKGDNMLGGCIWEFVDHAVYHENGPFEYTYGGDHGEWRHDGNFCVDGLFFPDRTPHSGALQMKNSYRPIRANKISENTYKFVSKRSFKACNFDLEWRVISDGTEIKSGSKELYLLPQEEKELTFEFSITDRRFSHNVIIFEYLEKGESVAFEQFELTDSKPQFACPKVSAPEVNISENRLFIDFDNGSMIFNAATGLIDSYVVENHQMINPTPLGVCRGIGVSLYRAPLDNDKNIMANWKKNGLDNETFSIKSPANPQSVYDVVENAVVITCNYVLSTNKKPNLATFTITYNIYKTGKIRVKVLSTSYCTVQNVPRFGAVLEMPKVYDNVKYYGMGPKESLSDFNVHCRYGIYELSVSNMHERYIKPQESSMRYGTRFACVTDNDGFGLRFDAIDAPFIFCADHFTSALCEKAEHKENLIDFDTTCIHIDSVMLGAGSNSCGPPASKENKVGQINGKSFEFSIEPLKKVNE